MTSLTMDDVFRLVQSEVQKIDDVRLFYEVRRRKLRYFGHQAHTKYLKIVIALTKLGLPITSNTVGFMTKTKTLWQALTTLHCLGDKHLLVLKRVAGQPYQWVASPLLLDLIESVEGKEK